nr:hypothetical protein [Tanacetum cinerariifolium]
EKSEQKKAERDKNKRIKKSDPVTVPNSLPAQSLETSFKGVGTEGINKVTTPPPPPSTLINKVTVPPPPPHALANKVAAPPPHPVVVNKVLDQLCSDDDLEWLFNRKEGKKPPAEDPQVHVWSEPKHIESVGVCALPYVIPY